MTHWKHRLQASTVHLFINLVIAASSALLVFLLWYPYPYRELSGGRELFLLLVAVDVVIGPLITLVIFNHTKTRRHLTIDFVVVGLLQLAALSYGLWVVFAVRPVHLVFEYQRMALVHAVDIEPALLAQAPNGLQALPLTGPTLLSLRPFRGAEEQFTSTMKAFGGIAQAAQPDLWQPYDAARTNILNESKPVSQLKERFPTQIDAIDRAVAEAGHPANALRYLPLLARKKAWTVLIDAEKAIPIVFLPLDSF